MTGSAVYTQMESLSFQLLKKSKERDGHRLTENSTLSHTQDVLV